MKKSATGFTIVELIIVIVVIAILAAITIVAYTGIQQRAKNSSIIGAASQSTKLIAAYIAVNSQFPLATSGDVCLVSGESACTASAARSPSTTLNNSLATLGSLPSTIPDARPEYRGIVYSYSSSGRTLDGNPLNLVLTYSLLGTNQQCGVSNVLAGTWNAFTTSTTGYHSSSSGYTLCVVAVPGP